MARVQRRGEVEDPVGLHPLEQRVAVPGLERLGQLVGVGRIALPHDAEAEERRHDRELQAVIGLDPVLERGEHAVARAALAGRGPAVQQPARPHPGHAGEQRAALDGRLAVLRGDLVGREVVVAAAVRPAHVVQEDERQRRVLRALADDAQLLANRVVVVVAVDDHRVGQRDGVERLVAGGADELELGPALVERDELLLRRGVDRPHSRAGTRRPVQQQPRQVPRIRADLHHRLHPRRLEARDQNLGVVEQRRAEVAGLVGVRVEVQFKLAHRSARYLRCRVPRRPA